MFHAIALTFITLTAPAPRHVHVLPAITVVATVRCNVGVKYDVRNPFTGRSAYFCATSKGE